MDGLSGAASIITVVGVALTSTQVLYNAVSGIRDAPETILQIASNLGSLSKLLQQLRESHESFHLSSDLEELVRKCAANLRTLEEKLGKLITSPESRVVRLWKSVKVLVQAKHLDKLADLVQQDVAALSLQLSIIEGYVFLQG